MSRDRVLKIDMDFEDSRREEVVNYIREKYGEDHVSHIVTFGTMAARNIIRDVGRVLEKDSTMIDQLAKSVPAEPKMTLEKAMKVSPDFKSMYDLNADAKEIIDIAEKLEGLSRQKSMHACFDKDTLINTKEGLKRIIDIQVGDEVLTCKNRFKPVVDLIKTETDTVYTIKTTNSFETKVTGNHPMYVREKLAKRVNNKKAYTSEAIYKPVEELQVGVDYIGLPINQESIIPTGNLPFDNVDFWWLIGRYLGDGWTEYPEKKNTEYREKRVIICCDKTTEDEKNEIIQHIINTGIEYRVEPANTTYKIFLKNDNLFDYLQNYGKYAYGKYVYGDALNLPVTLAEAVLEGYLSADGSYLKNSDGYSAKSVSKRLIMGMSNLVNKVYHRPCTFSTIPEKDEIIEGRVVHSKEKYTLNFTKDTRTKERSFYENGYIWSRVSSIEIEETESSMYNLTVLDDSSYIANGLGCHNCGIIVANGPIKDFVPEVLMEDKENKGQKVRTAAFNMVNKKIFVKK